MLVKDWVLARRGTIEHEIRPLASIFKFDCSCFSNLDVGKGQRGSTAKFGQPGFRGPVFLRAQCGTFEESAANFMTRGGHLDYQKTAVRIINSRSHLLSPCRPFSMKYLPEALPRGKTSWVLLGFS